MKDGFQEARPDTSKNGQMKRNRLEVSDQVKSRGQAVLSRLGKSKQQEPFSNKKSPE